MHKKKHKNNLCSILSSAFNKYAHMEVSPLVCHFMCECILTLNIQYVVVLPYCCQMQQFCFYRYKPLPLFAACMCACLCDCSILGLIIKQKSFAKTHKNFFLFSTCELLVLRLSLINLFLSFAPHLPSQCRSLSDDTSKSNDSTPCHISLQSNLSARLK